jgi:four helix bundle protein
MHNFRNLNVWKFSFDLVEVIYLMTNNFPDVEEFGLKRQIRRSSVSIPSNIAEGCGRNSNKQLSHFLDIAQGSACELETQILLSERLNFISYDSKVCLTKIHEIQKMIRGFRKSIN